jgi:hypothetical protein
VRLRAWISTLRLPTAVLLAAVLAPPAEAMLCAKRSGAVVFREACKRKEKALDLAAEGLTGAKGDAGPPGIAHPRIRAVDANGTRLAGTANELGDLIQVRGSAVFGLDLRSDGFAAGNGVLFETPDCTGPRRINALEGDLYHLASVHGPTAYYADGSIESRLVASRLEPSTAPNCTGVDVYDAATGLCCRQVNSSTTSAPASVLDLGEVVPPLSAEIEK